jgi:tetratricopeptide (TPR) repeat protein
LGIQEETMNRLLQGILVLISIAAAAAAQPNATTTSQHAANPAEAATGQLDKQQLLRLIATYEAAARHVEIDHIDPVIKGKLYERLGSLYADAALYLKAEDATRRAIGYLKNGSQEELAAELGQLAIVDLELGKSKQSEKDELEALRVRLAIGDPVGIAFVWKDLAGLYDEQLKFSKAIGFAERAYEVLGDRADVHVDDRIGVRQILGFALTGARDCTRGISMLKDALAIAQTSYGKQSVKVGYDEYVLGFGYWHCGDQANAAAWLQRGTTDMKADFGWDQTLYVNAMRQYARFLRSTGQLQAAASAEAVVNQADAVVDARSFTGRSEGFVNSGTK